jgi:flagellar biosynthesis protein
MKEKRRKAVALKYNPPKDRAPRLVAKGKGAVAEKILLLAKQHGVPVKEDTCLIEALSALDLYQEIPPDLYRAVAHILAFIYQMTNKKSS